MNTFFFMVNKMFLSYNIGIPDMQLNLGTDIIKSYKYFELYSTYYYNLYLFSFK